MACLAQFDWSTHLGWELTWWTVLGGLTFLLALLSIPSVLLQRQGRPQAAMSWVLILFLVPYLGLFLWWAIGRKHLERRRRKKRRSTDRLQESLSRLQANLPDPPETDWSLLPVKKLPTEDSELMLVPTRGNTVKLLTDSTEAYPAMEEVIASAREHLHLLFYIWQTDETGRRYRDLVVEKAKQGVKVRLLLDAIGGSNSRRKFMDPLRAAGGEVTAFMPPVFFRRNLDLNFRNHRKLVLADARVAIVGGLNIGNEYLSQWRDSALWIEGPAVDQLQEVFADDWYFATGEDFTNVTHFGGWRTDNWQPADEEKAICGVVASGPHSELNLTQEAFFTAISRANKRILLTTPYFVPDQTILAALRSAAYRGLDVRILVPEHNDHKIVGMASRSYYAELLRYGVRIFEYQPGLMHSKTVVVDDDLSMVGSANVDIRSFRLNFELSCFVQSRSLATQLAEVFDRDLAQSREVTIDHVEQSSIWVRTSEAAANLLSPLL